jgi:hypothetical protein
MEPYYVPGAVLCNLLYIISFNVENSLVRKEKELYLTATISNKKVEVGRQWG